MNDPLIVALIHTGQGEAAKALCQTRLEQNAQDIQAQYLMALAEIAQEQYEQAVNRLGRLIIDGVEPPELLCNLGKAQRHLGQWEESEKNLNQALDNNAKYSPAYYEKGLLFFDQAMFEQALECFTKVRALAPNNVQNLTAMGDAKRERGNIKGAIKSYRAALKLDPGYSTAHHNLSILFRHIDKLEQAIEHSHTAVKLAGENGLVMLNHGKCLWQLEALDDAMDAYATAVELLPDSPDIMNAVGNAWLEVMDLQQSDYWFSKAFSMDQDNVVAKCGLASIFREAGSPEKAIELLEALPTERLQQLAPAIGLARAHWDEGNIDDAITILDTLNNLHPQSTRVLCLLASIYSSAGNTDAAKISYEQALTINANCTPALNGLAMASKAKTPDAVVAALKQGLDTKTRMDGARASLHTGLAYYYDGIQQYENAASHILEANRLNASYHEKRGWDYSRAKHESRITALMDTFDANYFLKREGCGNSSRMPVFVVGVPRSGTTLTEQILAGHEDVIGIGERNYASRTFDNIFLSNADACTKKPKPSIRQAILALGADKIEQLSERYIKQLENEKTKQKSSPALHVVDKMPDNYTLIGWILTLFPQAKIIALQRNPLAIGLSCWMTQFKSIQWANDQADIAHRLIQHRRIMDHWNKVIPGRILTVCYEDLVSDPQNNIERMLDWIGLEWDENCLQFHRAKSVVRTASVNQVRQSIYTDSTARWRYYEEALTPMTTILKKNGLLHSQ